MQEHTRKHHTKESVFHINNHDHDLKESIDWKKAANEAFGNIPGTALNLRGLRNREGLTQQELGKAVGVEQSNISKMERGKRQVGVKIAKRLEKLFDIDYRLFL